MPQARFPPPPESPGRSRRCHRRSAVPPAAAETALAAFQEKWLDVAPYLEQAQQEDGTFLFPIADNASEYTSTMTSAMQAVALGVAPADEALPDANEDINDLF